MTSETTVSVVPSQTERLKISLHALLFVLGFSLVFIVGWGGSATLVGQVFGASVDENFGNEAAFESAG